MQDFTLLIGAKVDSNDIENQLKVISKKTHIDVKVNADTKELETLKTVTTKGTDSMGNLVTVTQKFNKEGTETSSVVTDISQRMGSATKETHSLGQSFLDTTMKVLKFGASTKIIMGFQDAIIEAKDTVFEFDSALTEFQKVSDLGGQELEDYTKRLGEMGAEVYRTRTEMLESATEFKKTGASEDESAELARVAEMYRNIADEQISSGESASFLTSQMKTFNFTADESMHIIDAVNEVSNNFAVSSSDVSSALTKTSSAMGVLGNSYEQTIGLVTSGTEILVGQASKVGRGLK